MLYNNVGTLLISGYSWLRTETEMRTGIWIWAWMEMGDGNEPKPAHEFVSARS